MMFILTILSELILSTVNQLLMDFIQWCYKAHEDTNHMYAEYLPYRYHLDMVVQVAKDFKHLISPSDFPTILYGCAGHDLIEDCRKTYNDILQFLTNTSVSEGLRIVDFLTKEPVIKDTRTDIEKVLSHGFDKKTSFRKM